jgi:hypothetical protein
MRLASAVLVLLLLVPATAGAAEKQPDPRRPWRIAMWSAIGVGVTTLGLAIGFTAYSQHFEQEKTDLLHGYSQKGATWTSSMDGCAAAERAGARDVMSACDSGRRWAITANVLYGVTGGIALATAFLYYRGYIRGAPTRVSVQPLAGPQVGGLSIGGRF